MRRIIVKTHNNLYTTIGNTTWLQRGVVALTILLLVAAAGLGIVGLPRPVAQAPAAVPVAPAAPATSNPNVPVIGAGSAYDGGSYGAAQPAAPTQPKCSPIQLPPGVDMSEITARIDDYVRRCSPDAAQPVAPAQPAAPTQRKCPPIELPPGASMSEVTSQINDYVRRCSPGATQPVAPAQPAALAQPNCNGIELPADADIGEKTARVNEYIHRCS
jgi:hypothetical protein